MGKKIKGSNPTQIFQEINHRLQGKRFAEAAAILRRAKFPPKEKKKADQLNINIHYFWALDAFEKKDYLQAISTLLMFVQRFKKKISLPIEKANMLLGLSYFYINDFGKAADYLATSKNNPTTYSFYFYYLLVLIYQKKYVDIAALTANHKKEMAFIKSDQKAYLAIAIALVASDFEKATTLLVDFTSTNKATANNIAGLKAILQEVPLQEPTKILKPLYKFFLKVPLTDEEERYLNKIPAFKAQVESLKNNQLQAHLVSPLKKLCEEGASLSRTAFEQCMELPEKYRSYLVYNQVAALFNEDIEETESEIIAILKKYEWYFFQIPEAVFLFAQIVYWHPDNFTPMFFWKNIESSLDRFDKTFSPLQLNRLSWRILGCIEDFSFSKQNNSDRRQNKLAKVYPQMLGLKWRQITESVFAPKVPLLDSALDIFTYPNFQYGSHIVLDKWESSLLGLYPDPAMVSMMLNRALIEDYMVSSGLMEGHMNDIYVNLLNKAQKVLIRATTEQEVNLKNKVVLDLFKLTNHAINRFEKDKQTTFGKKRKAQFFDAYHKMIVFFEEDQPDSEYFQDYKSFELAPKINRLAKVIQNDKKGKDTVELFQEHLTKGESNIIHQVLLNELRYTYSIEDALNTVLVYFRILIFEGGEDLESIVKQFGNLYIKRLRLPYVPQYPDTNFFDILERLTKEGTTPNHILTVSILTELYMPFLTRVVEPMYYNMAEKLLSYFLKTQKKQPNFDFNQVIIQQLKTFIKEAVEKRKIKKLGDTLKNAEQVFS